MVVKDLRGITTATKKEWGFLIGILVIIFVFAFLTGLIEPDQLEK